MPGVGATGQASGDMTAADHIEAVNMALRVHGRSQVRSVSWQRWGRTELVNLVARATTNQSAARALRIGSAADSRRNDLGCRPLSVMTSCTITVTVRGRS